MNKLRSDSHWSRLNREQLARLEGWLFNDNLDYVEVLRLAEVELGVKASLSSLKRYRQRVADKQAVLELREGMSFARSSKKAKKAQIHSHALVMRLAGMKAIEMGMELRRPDKRFMPLMQLLMEDRTMEFEKERMALEHKLGLQRSEIARIKLVQALASKVGRDENL